MAVTATPVFLQGPRTAGVQITNATGTTAQTLVPGSTNGIKVVAVNVATTDPNAKVFQLWIRNGGTDYLVGSYNVPALSGSNGTAASADLLRGGPSALIPSLPVDNDGQVYVLLGASDSLKVGVTSAVTATYTAHVTAICGDF